jgi:hypothetical protein
MASLSASIIKVLEPSFNEMIEPYCLCHSVSLVEVLVMFYGLKRLQLGQG